MGETLSPVSTVFNRSLRVVSRPDRLTGDPGAVLLREVLEHSGIVSWMTARLSDPRRKVVVTHDLASLIRTAVLLTAQGWRDHDDADALRHDPAFRLAASSAAGLTPLEGPGLASQPTLSRFTALMAEPANLKVLREAVPEMAGRGMRAERQGKRLRSVTLDVDSAPLEVHGHQPKAEWNGHCNARIYHPLITSVAETGDMLDARPRAGNVGTAEGALDVILDVVDRARKSFCDVAMVRIDAGFPSAALLAGLEARGIDYVSRLRANAALDRMAEPLMKRPPGRRPAEPRMWLHELRCQADSWDRPRRVILVVKAREGDLLVDRFFLVTSLSWTKLLRHEVPAHYRERGKAEGHMGELKDVLAPAFAIVARTNGATWLILRPTARNRTCAARRRNPERRPSMPSPAMRCACSSPALPVRSCTSPAAPWKRRPERDGACAACARGFCGPERDWLSPPGASPWRSPPLRHPFGRRSGQN